ncbi:MAG: hypothetical protein ACREB9_01870, partial [Thermoplasmata archaeon]
MIDLPDCSEYTDDVVSDDLLDAVDPGRLVRALAEAGAEGARAVLRSTAAEDAELQRALTHLRERLRRQAERDVRRSLGEYDQTLSELAIAERRSQEEIDRAMAELEEKLEQARARGRGAFTMPDLVSEVTAALLVPDASWNRPPPPPSIWQRIKAWFVHLWARLFHRRGTGGAPARLERRVPIATLALDGRTLGPSALGDALARLSPKEEAE